MLKTFPFGQHVDAWPCLSFISPFHGFSEAEALYCAIIEFHARQQLDGNTPPAILYRYYGPWASLYVIN